MYEADPDPYCYRGTTILKNKAGLVEQVRLDEFENAMTFARSPVRPKPTPRPFLTGGSVTS